MENYAGTVVDRPNRFIVNALLNGMDIECHLHDPGRLKELIYPGNSILIRKTKGKRTEYSITAALRDGEWILTDSRFHNSIASLFLDRSARKEVKVGKSRIDFLSGECYVEVKGCSLSINRIAQFPDAPSLRAVKHTRELADIVRNGGSAMIMVLVFSPDALKFQPKYDTDPVFSDAFYDAIESGVKAKILKFRTDRTAITYLGEIPVMDKLNQ